MLVVTKFNKNIDAVLPIVLLSSKCPLERYTHVSLLISLGFPAVSIANRVGHESATVTYRYAHMFPTEQTRMADKLNQSFSTAINLKEGN